MSWETQARLQKAPSPLWQWKARCWRVRLPNNHEDRATSGAPLAHARAPRQGEQRIQRKRLSREHFEKLSTRPLSRGRLLQRWSGFVSSFPRRHNRASVFATEEPAEQMTVAADPRINFLGDPNHSWNPKNQSHGHEQRHAHSDETKAARPAVDAAGRRHAMDRFQ